MSSPRLGDSNTNAGPSPTKTSTIEITEIASTPLETAISIPHRSTIVLNPAFITQEFDLLRFEAAAFDQLPSPLSDPDVLRNDHVEKDSKSPTYSTNLISSPYNNPGHYLDLTALPLSSSLFAKALTALKPVREDYATIAYTEALNFDAVLSVLRDLSTQAEEEWQEMSFYVVVFRSQLRDDVDQDWLYKLDYESHREACESGGLLKYWFGKSNNERRNLATCKCLDSFSAQRWAWRLIVN